MGRLSTHPAITTQKNIATFRGQIQKIGLSYDWDREVDTTDPDYVRWTQRIFLKLHEKSLAYTKETTVLWCEELLRLTRLQQKNLAFAAERLERYALHLVVGTTHTPAELLAHGWDESVLNRLFETTLGVPGLIELRDEVPELSVQLLARAVASSEVPLRRLTTPALNALRQHAWHGGYAELRGIVKSLALGSLNEDIDEHDVRQLVMPNDQSEHTISAIDAAVLDLPLREAREIFERMYFNFHLQHDGSNMTRLAEKTGLERTHLYRKLKDLGLR